MAKTPRYLPDIIIGTVLLALLVTVVSAWPLNDPPAAQTDATGVTPVIENRLSIDKPAPAATTVAGLFGFRPSAPVAPTVRQTDAPTGQPPPSIKYMGYVTAENGQAKYFFKEGRSGQVLTLYLGKDNGRGWKLVQIGATTYTIENNGTVFQVPK